MAVVVARAARSVGHKDAHGLSEVVSGRHYCHISLSHFRDFELSGQIFPGNWTALGQTPST